MTYDPESSPNIPDQRSVRGHRAETASPPSTDGPIDSFMNCLRGLLHPSSTESGEVTSLSEMKRKLKTLKKRIKHASSYLEKQLLQREYEILQREYSIERHRLRIAS